MDIRISINNARLKKLENDLRDIPGGARKALAGAINETAAEGKTAFSRMIREEVNIKSKDIKKHIDVRRATPTKLSGAVRLNESDRIPLKAFGARQTAKGVGYRISKKGKRGFIRSAFGPDISRLGKQVFTRLTPKRLPLSHLKRGPSAYGVGKKHKIHEKARVQLQPVFNKNLEQRVRALQKGFVK